MFLTKSQLVAMNPCGNQTSLFGHKRKMNAAQALEAGASISDLCWVAGKLGRKDLLVKFALRCAQDVSHLNTDRRIQVALDATQAWLANPNQQTAYAAYAAADAANSADAAKTAKAAAASAAKASAAKAAAYAAKAAAYATDNTANAAKAAASAAAKAAANAADAAKTAKAAAASAARQQRAFIEIFDSIEG